MDKKVLAMCCFLFLVGCASQPKMISKEEMALSAQTELSEVYENKIDGSLNLQEVVAHTLMRNMDLHTKKYELEIEQGKKLATTLDYLPQLQYQRREIDRDSLLLSTSSRLGRPIAGVDTIPSYSSLKDTTVDSLRLSWDILNVFKNFLTSKQNKNSIMIAKYNRERVAQNTFRDILPAFHLVNIKQNEGARLSVLSNELKSNLDNVCSLIANKDEVIHRDLMKNCDSALTSHSLVQDLSFRLNEAEYNLKAMLSVATDYKISLDEVSYTDPGELKLNIDQLIDFALVNRPELFIEQYHKRNAQLERKKAWLDILPSVELSFSDNNSDNPFLVNQDWEEESVDITWNIIGKLIKAPLNAKQAKRKEMLANSRYRALLITTITQVEVAYEAYNKDRLKWIGSYQKALVSSRLGEQGVKMFKSGDMSKVDYLEQEITTIQKVIQAKADYVRMIDSLSMLYLSLGVPVMPLVDSSNSIEELARSISKQLQMLSIIDSSDV